MKTQVAQLENENLNLKNDLECLKVKYNQLRLDNSDLSESYSTLSITHETTKQQLDTALKKFNQLKHHAEKKLEEANIEIARVRQTNETEICAIRAKLSRADMKIKTLERGIDEQGKENKELSRICDELVQQIEVLGPNK